MLVEAVALDMGAEKGERRIYCGEIENFPWLSYHVEVGRSLKPNLFERLSNNLSIKCS